MAFINELENWIKTFAHQHPQIKKVILFGSFARKDFGINSDIDLCLLVHDQTQFEELSRFANPITLKKIDVVHFEKCGESLRKKFYMRESPGMKESKLNQSLANLNQTLSILEQALLKNNLSDLEISGALKNFELSYEILWKTIKKIADTKGVRIASPRDAFQFAHASGYIVNEKTWIEMIADRNLAVYVYSRELAEEIFSNIKKKYLKEIQSLKDKISGLI